MPSLSVLVTYYNEGSLLRECLESLLDGDEQPDEILVYDDASPDVPASDIVPDTMPVNIIRGDENVGPSRGRNRLLEHASTDYVHYHDADDLFHADWCRRVRERIEATGPDVVFTEIASRRNGTSVSEQVLGLDAIMRGDVDLLRFCLLGSMLVPAGTYRRQCLADLDGYREDIWQAEDYDLNVRLALQNPDYQIIPEPLLTIRLRADGRSRRNRHEVTQSVVQIARSLRERIPAEYHTDLAEKVSWAGSLLYQSGRHDKAKQAFQLAADLGPPQEYAGKHRLYQVLARAWGGYVAEQVSAAYRTLLPQGLRARLPRS
jgi:glycosyltransferase involved in cell wall biosynthesis